MIKTEEYLAGMIDDWEVRPIQSAWYKASRLHLLDISNPALPARRGTYEYGGFISDVVFKGDYAFLATHGMPVDDDFVGGGLEIVDLSSPDHPVLVNIIPTEGMADAVAVSENLLLVGGSAVWNRPSPGSIDIFDIENPRQPLRIAKWEPEQGTINFDRSGRGITISAGLAWIHGSTGLRVIDISDPTNPISASHDSKWRGQFAENLLFGYTWVETNEGSGYQLQAFDVSDPTSPKLLGQLPQGVNIADPAAITVFNNHVYLADQVEGLRIFRFEPVGTPLLLSAELISDELLLQWPATDTEFVLESSMNPTATSWTPVPGTPQLNGDHYKLAVPLDSPARFFRLRKP